MSNSWTLTVLNDQDEKLHQGSYCTLTQIASIFGLKRGSDLAHYRAEPSEHTRELMLDRFGVWFLIDEEEPKPLPALKDFFEDDNESDEEEEEHDNSDDNSDDDEEDRD